ncbi:MAG TPA: aminopeptidase, partial [Oceanithermus profundus]|nr:aminopeptidase [Oceanithermus profundus]
NVDNVGAGTLHYATGEGMLAYYPHRGPLLAAARELEGAVPVAYRLAYFDTLPFARPRRAVLTLIRLAGGVPPNWHWPSDTPAGVRWFQVEETYAYASRLLGRLLPLKEG